MHALYFKPKRNCLNKTILYFPTDLFLLKSISSCHTFFICQLILLCCLCILNDFTGLHSEWLYRHTFHVFSVCLLNLFTYFVSSFSLLASASRDRLIHLFDVSREYSFLTTLDDHSSSITAIRFLKMPPRPGVENSVQIASCGADKSIIFRDISSDHKGGLEFTRGNHIVGKTTLYDMETDVSYT